MPHTAQIPSIHLCMTMVGEEKKRGKNTSNDPVRSTQCARNKLPERDAIEEKTDEERMRETRERREKNATQYAATATHVVAVARNLHRCH